jgi:hypothetical protein
MLKDVVSLSVIERERIEGVEGTCGIQNGNLTNAANSM